MVVADIHDTTITLQAIRWNISIWLCSFHVNLPNLSNLFNQWKQMFVNKVGFPGRFGDSREESRGSVVYHPKFRSVVTREDLRTEWLITCFNLNFATKNVWGFFSTDFIRKNFIHAYIKKILCSFFSFLLRQLFNFCKIQVFFNVEPFFRFFIYKTPDPKTFAFTLKFFSLKWHHFEKNNFKKLQIFANNLFLQRAIKSQIVPILHNICIL